MERRAERTARTRCLGDGRSASSADGRRRDRCTRRTSCTGSPHDRRPDHSPASTGPSSKTTRCTIDLYRADASRDRRLCRATARSRRSRPSADGNIGSRVTGRRRPPRSGDVEHLVEAGHLEGPAQPRRAAADLERPAGGGQLVRLLGQHAHAARADEPDAREVDDHRRVGTGAGVGQHGPELARLDQVDLAPHEHGDHVVGQRRRPRSGAAARWRRRDRGPHGLRRYPNPPGVQPCTSSAISSRRNGGPLTSIVVTQLSRQASRSSRTFSLGPTR